MLRSVRSYHWCVQLRSPQTILLSSIVILSVLHQSVRLSQLMSTASRLTESQVPHRDLRWSRGRVPDLEDDQRPQRRVGHVHRRRPHLPPPALAHRLQAQRVGHQQADHVLGEHRSLHGPLRARVDYFCECTWGLHAMLNGG